MGHARPHRGGSNRFVLGNPNRNFTRKINMQTKRELFRFVIPIKATSWNTLVGANRWHCSRTRDFWKQATIYAARKLRPKQPYNIPVRLVFEAHWRTKRAHDCDNLFVKPIIDQLKMDRFFHDDSTRFVSEVVLRGLTDQAEDSLTVIAYEYIPE
mgnify:CR=1 FL=1